MAGSLRAESRLGEGSVLTVVLRAMKVDEGIDQTRPQDYHADTGDPGVEEELHPETPIHA